MRTVFSAAVLLAASGAYAQAPGSLAGVVVDALTQAPVAEAQVTARGPAMVGEQTVLTDETGAFEMTFLPAGTYALSVKRDGFQPFSPEGLVLKGRKVHVRLAIMPASQAQVIVENALEFNESMTAPTMVSGPNPEYTQDAIERGIEGVIQVRCVVTVAGMVRACKVVKGLPYMDRPVIDALQARKYRPALAAGKPVDVFYTFTIRLKLPQ
jgi:TonB family protein